MLAVAAYSTVAVALQLTVPSYALRLVRRFGTQRVGWFLVAAFVLLGLVHLLQPVRTAAPVYHSALNADVVYALTSVLLLIGMCHMESRFSVEEQSRIKQERIRAKWEVSLQEKNLELAETHETLLREIAWREQNEKALAESEADYHFLFAENPQPMWIYDLASGRLLAVNSAALRQYGFAQDEFEQFMALTVRDIWPADGLLKRSHTAAGTAGEPQPLGWWQHRTKDGTLIDVEVTALDLTYAGFSARLVLPNDVHPRWRHQAELRQTGHGKLTG